MLPEQKIQLLSQEFKDFAIKVFNYYNGKINKVVPAIFDISYKYDGTAVGAITKYPNKVTLLLNTVMIFYSVGGVDGDLFKICINEVKTNIIECIIHELYHVDQYIDYTAVVSDKQYVDLIEANVRFMTSSYILLNYDEIYNLFGVEINKQHQLIENKEAVRNGFYTRYTNLTYLLSFISDTVCTEDMRLMCNRAINTLYNNNGTLIINVTIFADIKLNNPLSSTTISRYNIQKIAIEDIISLNNTINLNNGIRPIITNIKEDLNSNILTIYIANININHMCKKVK